MRRLIDAEKLSAEFDEIINFLENGTKATETISKEAVCECIKALRECVDEQPTAYVVEKVVEQIKKSATDEDGLIVFDGKEPMIWKSKAIEIVRMGGVE